MTPAPSDSFHPEMIARHLKDAGAGKALPPVDDWQPDFCGDIDIQIKRDGSWYYMGTPISRAPMVRLFSTVLRRDEDGRYYLVTPVEKVGITVEDAPFVAVSLRCDGDDEAQQLYFTTNVGDEVAVDSDHPVWIEEGDKEGSVSPYVRVRGRLHALINRPTYYELVGLAVEQDGMIGVWSGGAFFSLGKSNEKGEM